jgi:hypothetical protein
LYGCPAGTGRTHRDDAIEGGEERCNTRSTLETSRYNSCNMRLKAVETLEMLLKHMKKYLKTIATSK